MMSSANEIRQMRQRAGMTMRELADRLCISHTAVSRYESGYAEPRHSLMEQMRAVCRVNRPAISPFIPLFDTEDRSGECAQ